MGRRRAVAGLVAALIVFGLVFTTGVTYYLYESNLSLTSAQAAANLQASTLQAKGERLSLAAYNASSVTYNKWLYVEAYNSGGPPVTITSVFVTNTIGKLLSVSSVTGSNYLEGPPDLNVTLPLSVPSGVNTTSMSGCAHGLMGCSIGINRTAFPYGGGTVFLNVLTSSGNVFTFMYPPNTNSTTSTSTVVVASSTTSVTSTYNSNMTIVSTTTVTSSQTIGYGFGVGTNSLIVSMRACPAASPTSTNCGTASAVYQGGPIVLKINVTNFANVAMSTFVNFQSVGTNGATVSDGGPSPCAGGKTSTVVVPADLGTPGKGTYSCTFTGNVGPTGGTVTFIGYAVGTYTVPPAGPVTITSAETTSNPLPLGNVASGLTGPWMLNYYSFNYASSQSHSFSPAVQMDASANSQVIFQVQVTNTANSSLTIMQYTYLQIARTSQEMDYYIVQPVTSWQSLGSFSCTTSGSGPSGANCMTVGVGSTVTLSFAACKTAQANFLWNNLGGGASSTNCGTNDNGFNPPEGVVGLVVIVYGYHIGTTWYTYSQTLPSMGMYVY